MTFIIIDLMIQFSIVNTNPKGRSTRMWCGRSDRSVLKLLHFWLSGSYLRDNKQISLDDLLWSANMQCSSSSDGLNRRGQVDFWLVAQFHLEHSLLIRQHFLYYWRPLCRCDLAVWALWIQLVRLRLCRMRHLRIPFQSQLLLRDGSLNIFQLFNQWLLANIELVCWQWWKWTFVGALGLPTGYEVVIVHHRRLEFWRINFLRQIDYICISCLQFLLKRLEWLDWLLELQLLCNEVVVALNSNGFILVLHSLSLKAPILGHFCSLLPINLYFVSVFMVPFKPDSVLLYFSQSARVSALDGLDLRWPRVGRLRAITSLRWFVRSDGLQDLSSRQLVFLAKVFQVLI